MLLLLFTIDGHKYAIDSSSVRRVVRMVEITPLPGGTEAILGVINVQGDLVPVIDLRRCFRMPGREMDISDQLIIVYAEGHRLALPVDETEGVIDCQDEALIPVAGVLSGTEYIGGVAKHADGMVLIYNLDKLLALAGSVSDATGGQE